MYKNKLRALNPVHCTEIKYDNSGTSPKLQIDFSKYSHRA